MSMLVVAGATLRCSFGLAPGVLRVLPRGVTASGQPVARIDDNRPVVNLAPFGMCTAPTNPAVVSATTAAAGVPTPAPCVPAVTAPWTRGSPSVLVGRVPALTATSTCLCNWMGAVTVVDAGQRTTRVAG